MERFALSPLRKYSIFCNLHKTGNALTLERNCSFQIFFFQTSLLQNFQQRALCNNSVIWNSDWFSYRMPQVNMASFLSPNIITVFEQNL